MEIYAKSRPYLSQGYIRPIPRGHPFHGVFIVPESCEEKGCQSARWPARYPLRPYTPFLVRVAFFFFLLALFLFSPKSKPAAVAAAVIVAAATLEF